MQNERLSVGFFFFSINFFFSCCLAMEDKGVPLMLSASADYLGPEVTFRRGSLRARAVSAPALAKPFAGLHFLLVDDNEMNRRIGRAVLVRLGSVVDIANDGLQACEFDGLDGIAAIFMDVSMPVRDGIEATRELRAAGFEKPIIGVSAREENRAPAIAAGMNLFYAAKVPTLVVRDAGFIERVLRLCGTQAE